jgi:hypothetical protein
MVEKLKDTVGLGGPVSTTDPVIAEVPPITPILSVTCAGCGTSQQISNLRAHCWHAQNQPTMVDKLKGTVGLGGPASTTSQVNAQNYPHCAPVVPADLQAWQLRAHLSNGGCNRDMRRTSQPWSTG